MQAPPASLTELRRRVDGVLRSFLAQERASLPPEAGPLVDELEALIAAGGKRLRPLFCYWGYRAAGGAEGVPILRAAAALELLHTFAIVHDDLMDRSPRRRGRPASHLALAGRARAAPHRGDPDRFGASAAVLAGDLALVLADRLLQRSGFPPAALARARERYDAMRLWAIGGQYLDLWAAHTGPVDEETALRIAALKSGGYTVADPLQVGAALAGPPPEVVGVLAAYGRPLGQAFQLRDDVLGVFGDPAVTGKDRDGDLREGKPTVLVAKARALAGDADRRFLDDHLGRPDLTPAQAEQVREILRRTGALDATLELIAALALQAKGALREEVLGAEATGALEELADLATQREA